MVLALAALPLPYLLRRPRVGLWYALVFIPLAVVVSPQPDQGLGESTPRQMYYWAAGLFIVLLPVGLGVVRRLRPFGWSRLKRAGIPTSLVALVGISLAACVQGLRLGSPLSYVLRQFYGILLFCVGFVATLLFVGGRSEVRRVLRQLRWLVLALSAYTIILYSQEEGSPGFFKGNISLFSATLAVYCAGEFLCARGARRRMGWAALALLFLVHPILFVSRGAVGLAGITVLVGLALRIRSRALRYFMVVGVFAFFVASIALGLYAGLSQSLEQYGLAGRLVPADVLSDPSALGRISQFDAALDVVRQHPLLGLGLGSTLTWFDPTRGEYASAALVDNGWAYILSKMGLLGVAAFLWFVVSVLRRFGWPGPDGLRLGLFLIALFQLLCLMVGPIMIYFVYAIWAGASWGLLYQSRAVSCLADGMEIEK